ncbi:type II toxin-antitoxin system Phd/YefM family antitoxin [Actinomyces sp.]|uniref:type II toxin-antitoxin system Phd/YefM family antitoxin n=1 Tax=Actinomyces sp. TaxID=29317 RepID=UPI0034C68573
MQTASDAQAGDACSACYGTMAMTTIPHRELRNDSAAILRRVEAGESFEITNNGRPVAELVPITHESLALLRRQRATRPAVPTDFNALKRARGLSSKDVLDDLRGGP